MEISEKYYGNFEKTFVVIFMKFCMKLAIDAYKKLILALTTPNFVAARSTITGSSDVPDQQRYIDQVEALESYQKNQHQYKTEPEPPESVSPPEFITPIKSQKNIPEGGFAHFDARLEPLNDSTLHVEWLKDGKPVEASKKFSY